MQIANEMQAMPVECFHNGRRATLSLEEACQLFWQVEFAWLLPLDWYRYNLGGRQRKGSLYKDVSRSARVLAYYLMRRGHRGLTLEDIRILDKRSEFIGREAFHARMARLNTGLFDDLPSEVRPFDHTEVFHGNLEPIPAYRLKPDREVLLVVEAAPNSDIVSDEIDWAIFQTPHE